MLRDYDVPFPQPSALETARPGDFVIVDARDHVREPGLPIDIVELCGLNQGVDRRSTTARHRRDEIEALKAEAVKRAG